VIGSGRVPWNFQQLRASVRRCGGEGSIHRPACSAWVWKILNWRWLRRLSSRRGARVPARRLRSVNGEPVAVVTSYLPARIFTGIDKQDLEKQSLFIFEHSYKRKLQWAEE